MYRKSDWMEIALFGLAVVLLYAGVKLGLPLLTNLGGLCIGAFGLVAGIQTLRTKHLGFETRQKNFGPITTYTGLAAQLWGALFLAFAGLVFVLVGVAWFYPGGAEAFWSSFFATSWGWGFILIAAGAAFGVSGLATLLAGSGGYYKGLQDRVIRASGFLPLFFGMALAALGLFLILFPGWLGQMFQRILGTLFH
jgi:hypothetical protein